VTFAKSAALTAVAHTGSVKAASGGGGFAVRTASTDVPGAIAALAADAVAKITSADSVNVQNTAEVRMRPLCGKKNLAREFGKSREPCFIRPPLFRLSLALDVSAPTRLQHRIRSTRS
jgi:hypothetical protein